MSALKQMYWYVLGINQFSVISNPIWSMCLSLLLLTLILSTLRARRIAGIWFAVAGIQAVAILAIGWIIVTALLYPLFQGYIDHFEPVVSSLTWVLVQGEQPLYHAIDATARYSIQYAPMVYMIDSIPFLLFGGSIAASKIMGVLSCLVSIFMVFTSIRCLCDFRSALLLTGIMVIGFLMFDNQPYWNRPDPFLIFCVSLGLLAVTIWSGLFTAIALGIGCGAAINLKIHGILYMLPIVSIYLARRPTVANIRVAFLVALATSIAPFLLPQVSFSDYLKGLRISVRHGIDKKTLFDSVFFLMPMMSLMMAVKFLRTESRTPLDIRVYGFTIVVEALLITIVSGKPGAGPHHYLPILPAIAYGCALLLEKRSFNELIELGGKGLPSVGWVLFGASVMALIPTAVLAQVRVVKYLLGNSAQEAAAQDVKEILAANPAITIGMGYSDNDGYILTYVRPLIVFGGNPYFLDAGALMDYDAANIAMPNSTIEELRKCHTNLWVIPKEGSPFSMINWYSTGRNIFSNDFQRAFLEEYEKTGSTRLYDIWSCRRKL